MTIENKIDLFNLKDKVIAIIGAGLIGKDLIKYLAKICSNVIIGEKEIGHVTSGTFSPSMNKGMGMGYVDKPHNKTGTRIQIAGKKPLEGEVIKGPFYKQGSHK